jgi:hypothetical protein
MVPGLLKTAEYARRVLAVADPTGGQRHDMSAALGARIKRQEILYDDSGRFEFLITEAALRWQSHDRSLIVPQMARISSAATLSNVWVGLLPHKSAEPLGSTRSARLSSSSMS